MVRRADGESKQEAEVELYQMEINFPSLVGHQYCKIQHFECFLFSYGAKGHRDEAKVGLVTKQEEKKFYCLHEICKTD